ncbi:hypothetical protein SAY87_015821 [Trapa incisa]|uniref:Uncharacterized protein n=1 Tax=Trapa incisa TaxID=236973 RepID=A0AAN7L7C1_9MYRT|nr:hypothetical protein SAY87_015821 [Trapa incisa]
MNIHRRPDGCYFSSSQRSEDVLEVAEETLSKDTMKESKCPVLLDSEPETPNSSGTDVGDLDGFWEVPEYNTFYLSNSNPAEINAMEVKDHEPMIKSENELEEPEMVICYKDYSYHNMKEYYVDEDLPSLERMLSETEVGKKELCTLLLLEEDDSFDLTIETREVTSPSLGHTKFCEALHSSVPKEIAQTEAKVNQVAEDVSLSSETEDVQKESPPKDACSDDTHCLKDPDTGAIPSLGHSLTAEDEGSLNASHARRPNNGAILDMEEKSSAESNFKNGQMDSSDCGNQEMDQNIPKVHRSLGEMSFSRLGTAPELTTCSNSTVHSGNLSPNLSPMSDSSNASSISFTFPA